MALPSKYRETIASVTRKISIAAITALTIADQERRTKKTAK
jgi:hypothetical protein